MRGGFGFALVLVMAPSPCCCAPRPWPADAASWSSAEVGREGKRGWPERVARGAAARRRVGTKPSPEHVYTVTSYACSSPTIGGDGACRCQVNPKIQGNSGVVMAARAGRGRIGRPGLRLLV